MIIYDKCNYNCAHHAIKRYNEINGTEIHFSTGDEWQVAFIRSLRKDFRPLKKPIYGCLAVMTDILGNFHLGIYRNYAIEHNYLDGVIISDIGTITTEFERLRYYGIHKAV